MVTAENGQPWWCDATEGRVLIIGFCRILPHASKSFVSSSHYDLTGHKKQY